MVKSKEIKQLEMELCMAEIKKDIEYIKTSLDEYKGIMNNFINTASSKYALKYVEEKMSRLEKKQIRLEIIMATAYGGLLILYILIKIIFKI